MEVHTVLKKLFEETQAGSENYLKIESQINSDYPRPYPDQPPRPPPKGGPGDCSAWYIWCAIIVIIVAILTLVGILVYFCRRSRDRRSSLEAIITNIELQNTRQNENGLGAVVPSVVPNRTNQQVILNGDSPARIKIIQKY